MRERGGEEGRKGRSGKRKREGKEERRNKIGRIIIFLSNVHNWVGGGEEWGGEEKENYIYTHRCCLLLNPT